MSNFEIQKKAAAAKAVGFVQDGMKLGLGSGSTMYEVLCLLADRIAEGLEIEGVASSLKTEKWAKEMGIPLIELSEVSHLDLAIDGANEIGPGFNLIKGGGGSLLREKLVNEAAREVVIAADESKMVSALGAFPLPVEIVPFGWRHTANRVGSLHASYTLRMDGEEIFVTDNGNYILDCRFDLITDPAALHHSLKMMLGVVETGLFINGADKIVLSKNAEILVLVNTNK